MKIAIWKKWNEINFRAQEFDFPPKYRDEEE
jgi:hypothetical protein